MFDCWFGDIFFRSQLNLFEIMGAGEALRVIGRRLGQKAWNFTVDPCSGELGWVVSTVKDTEQAVNCNCSIGNDGACHVTSM